MKKLVMTLSVLSVLLFACTSGGDQTVVSPFFGGTQGLQLSFVDGSPPSTPILDQGRVAFDAVLNVDNVGEWDVSNANDATFTISGISPTVFGKTSADFSKSAGLPLLGIQKDAQGNKLPGTNTQIQFSNLAYKDKIAGSVQFTIAASACYKYGTKATTKVCVRNNILNPSAGGCDVRGIKQLFVSGAPVSIENFQQSVEAANRIAFTFNVAPKGTGSYYALGSGCPDTIAAKNKVKVTVSTGIGNGPMCNLQDETGNAINSNSGYVTIFGASRIVRCSQEIPAGEIGDYEKAVDLVLEYDNKDTITKTITVSS